MEQDATSGKGNQCLKKIQLWLKAGTLIILALAAAGIMAAQPADPSILVNEQQPDIGVAFSEAVDPGSLAATLVNSSGEEFDVQFIRSVQDMLFIYRPVAALPQGSYTFIIDAKDTAGNPVQEQVRFTVVIPPIDITILSPRFGYSPEFVFPATINISRRAYCKYWDISSDNFDLYQEFDSPRAEAKEHTIRSFSLENTPEQNGVFSRSIYVKCEDTIRGEFPEQLLTFVVDQTPPTVTLRTSYPDNLITDLPTDAELIASTDEDAVCKYWSGDAAEIGFDDMIPFPDYTNEIYSTQTSIPLTSIITEDQRSYSLSVTCKNKAGLVPPEKADIEIQVNTLVPLQIISTDVEWAESSTARLLANTNKIAQCTYSDTPEDPASFLPMSSTGSRTHSVSLAGLAEGSYSYTLRCLRGSQADEAVINFIVDTTPPTITRVDDSNPDLPDSPQFTASTKKLHVTVEASDDESEIVLYNYTLYRKEGILSNERIESSQDASPEITLTGLDLENNKKYFFRVEAKNAVNLWSSSKDSDGITVDTSLVPEECTNEKRDLGEIGIDCGGACPTGCALGKECRDNEDCISRFCAIRSGRKNGICAESTCSDKKEGPDETDVDCGGACLDEGKKCSSGKKCEHDTDCTNGECIQGRCGAHDSGKPSICTNGKLDLDEKGIDCGGLCVTFGKKCPVDTPCDFDSDCLSNSCQSGSCTASSDNDGDGIDNDIDNCPRDPNPSQEDMDADGIGDLCDKDKDGDGMDDDWEIQHSLDPTDPSDASLDPDEDGLTNLEEFRISTNPNQADTDGDGWSDRDEVDAGTDPNDPNSKPRSVFFWAVFFSIVSLLGIGGAVAYFYYERTSKHSFGKKALPPLPKIARPASRAGHTSFSRQLQKQRHKRSEKLFGAFGGAVHKAHSADTTAKPAPRKQSAEWLDLGKHDVFHNLPKTEKKHADIFSELKTFVENQIPGHPKPDEPIKKLREARQPSKPRAPAPIHAQTPAPKPASKPEKPPLQQPVQPKKPLETKITSPEKPKKHVKAPKNPPTHAKKAPKRPAKKAAQKKQTKKNRLKKKTQKKKKR